MLTTEQLRSFGANGYLVVPGVVDEGSQAAALARIDTLLRDQPPRSGHTGHHFYWRDAADEPILMGLLTATGALAHAEGLWWLRTVFRCGHRCRSR